MMCKSPFKRTCYGVERLEIKIKSFLRPIIINLLLKHIITFSKVNTNTDLFYLKVLVL